MSTAKQYSPKAAPQPKLRINQKHLRDLASSGISPEAAEIEKVFSMPASLSVKILGRPLGTGLCFQFGQGFYRVKLDRKMEDAKQYRQRRGSVNRLYVPRILQEGVLQDPTIPLYITEGEKKAIKMCQEGLWAIAATGVNSWLHDKEPIPDLDLIACEGRTIIIVFDSDPSERSKGQVDHARRWLAAAFTVRGANVLTVHLPDDGQTKVGADDYLVARSVEDFLALPRESVPLFSPMLHKKGKGKEYNLSVAVETLIWHKIHEKVKPDSGVLPDFNAPVRTILNFGMKADHLTTRIKFRGEPRIQVGKSTYGWPCVVVYYNALFRAMQLKGKHIMATIPRKWMPIWQGLMGLEAGELMLPDEYKSTLPACAPQEARDVLEAWAKTLWIRQREYPGCAASFSPGTLSVMLGKPMTYILTGWEWLTMYGYIDATWQRGQKDDWYVLGRNPIADPEEFDREILQMSDDDFFKSSEANQVVDNLSYEAGDSPSVLIKSGETTGVHSEVNL